MTLRYVTLGKPGNIEEAVYAAEFGRKVDITPTVTVNVNPKGERLGIDYYIRLQIVNGGYSKSLKLGAKELGNLGTSEPEVLIKTLEKAIEIEEKLTNRGKDVTIRGNKPLGLKEKIKAYKSIREEMKKPSYTQELLEKNRKARNELIDLAKEWYIDFASRIRYNIFRDLAMDLYIYLRHLGGKHI